MFVSSVNIGVDSPETLRVRLKDAAPGLSLYIYRNSELYYLREIGDFDAININLKQPGNYTFSTPIEIINRQPICINCPIKREDLPQFERKYPLPDKWEKDIEIGRSPARMFPAHGIIETGERFNGLPLEWKIYVLLHELAHSYYKTEWKADTLALFWFCKLGYNHSQALYSLSKVLKQSPENMNRIYNVYKYIKP